MIEGPGPKEQTSRVRSRPQPWEDGTAEIAFAELVRQTIVKNQGCIGLRGWDEGVG